MKLNATEFFSDATSQVKRWLGHELFRTYDAVAETKAFELMESSARTDDTADDNFNAVLDAANCIEYELNLLVEDDFEVTSNSDPASEFFRGVECTAYMDGVRTGKVFACDIIANRLAKVWRDHGDTEPHRDIIRILARDVDGSGNHSDERLSRDDFYKASLFALDLL